MRTVRVLAVSDRVEEGLWSETVRRLGADLVAACGDLPFEYLAWLGDALEVPVVFVPGNHDPELGGYRRSRAGLTLRAGIPTEAPWPPGAVNVDGCVVTVGGRLGRLRVAGLGGCVRYGDGPNQYTERQQRRRARRLVWRARCRPAWGRGRRVDVLLTHAPPRGVGDGDDPAHRGFACHHQLVAALRPRLLLHGHVDPPPAPVATPFAGTRVLNVVGHRLVELPLQDPADPGVILAERVVGREA